MRYLSVCSGIEAASVAWHSLGWEPVAFAEIDPFPCAVLKYRFPHVPNWGDFTKIGGESGPIDILVGGTPCQSFSVAGLRRGLDDDRGNLALEFLRLADRLRPRWVVWENVPGVLSTVNHDAPDSRPPDIDLDGDDGPPDGEEVVVEDEYDADEVHAFACFLSGLQEFGYGFAYRVLDAQYAGVPQRRRRVFVVGHLGDWRRAAAVLFERHSLSGNPPPGREAGQVAASSLTRGLGSGGACAGRAQAHHLVAPPCTSNPYGDHESREGLLVSHTLRGGGFDASEDGTGRGTPLSAVAYQQHGSDVGEMGALRRGHGDVQSGVPFIVNAAESCAIKDHARRSDVARCIDSTGSFANAQGGTVVAYDLRNMAETGDVSQTLQVGDHGASPNNTPHVVQTYNIIGLGQNSRSHAYPTETSGCLQHKGLSASGNEAGTVVMQPIPIDMRQASRGDTMTNNRREGSSGGAPGTGIGEPGDPSPSLSLSHPPAIAFQERGREGGRALEWQEDQSYALRAIDGGGCGDWFRVACHSAVRRLTPWECERLQGFPDDYTLIPFRGKPAADGNRYKALGNSMAVPVMRWIGERINRVDNEGRGFTDDELRMLIGDDD